MCAFICVRETLDCRKARGLMSLGEGSCNQDHRKQFYCTARAIWLESGQHWRDAILNIVRDQVVGVIVASMYWVSACSSFSSTWQQFFMDVKLCFPLAGVLTSGLDFHCYTSLLSCKLLWETQPWQKQSGGVHQVNFPLIWQLEDGATTDSIWFHAIQMMATGNTQTTISNFPVGSEHLDNTIETDRSSLILLECVGGTKIGWQLFLCVNAL